jgi:dephospho-CoA kinase
MAKLIVGLTGGIASGKSQVANYFKQLKVDVIDADEIARNLFAPSSPHLNSLRNHFGDGIFNPDESLNRKALGEIVFADSNELKWLNNLTHPLVAEQIQQQLQLSQSSYVVLDIPLLVKKDGTIPEYLQKLLNRILVVDVTPDTQIKRVTQRDKISPDQAKRIINTQATREQRNRLANDILDNNGSFESLEKATLALHQHYLSESFD